MESVNIDGTNNVINGEDACDMGRTSSPTPSVQRDDIVVMLFLRCPLSACKERSIPRLVYTSTINVVFTGEPIEERDETSVPHVPPSVVSKIKAI